MMISSNGLMLLLVLSVSFSYVLAETAERGSDIGKDIPGFKSGDELLRSLREARLESEAQSASQAEFVKDTIHRIKRQVEQAVSSSPLMGNPVVAAIVEPLFALIRTVTDYIIHLTYVLLGVRQVTASV